LKGLKKVSRKSKEAEKFSEKYKKIKFTEKRKTIRVLEQIAKKLKDDDLGQEEK